MFRRWWRTIFATKHESAIATPLLLTLDANSHGYQPPRNGQNFVESLQVAWLIKFGISWCIAHIWFPFRASAASMDGRWWCCHGLRRWSLVFHLPDISQRLGFRPPFLTATTKGHFSQSFRRQVRQPPSSSSPAAGIPRELFRPSPRDISLSLELRLGFLLN